MGQPRSWWRRRQVRHRDAVALSVVASACLLAGELANEDLPSLYRRYLAPVAGDPLLFAVNLLLTLLAFTPVFGGILVLLGGIHFSWGRVGHGRFLVSLGVGFSAVGLLSRLAYATLTYGSPLAFLVPLTTTLTGVGLLLGLAAHLVMGEYALLIKRHARSAWRRWRRAHRPTRRTAHF